jgi:hypothetical protein
MLRKTLMRRSEGRRSRHEELVLTMFCLSATDFLIENYSGDFISNCRFDSDSVHGKPEYFLC